MTTDRSFYQAKKIIFTDRTELQNVQFVMTDRFIILESEENENSFNWYNINLIRQMNGVELVSNTNRSMRVTMV